MENIKWLIDEYDEIKKIKKCLECKEKFNLIINKKTEKTQNINGEINENNKQLNDELIENFSENVENSQKNNSETSAEELNNVVELINIDDQSQFENIIEESIINIEQTNMNDDEIGQNIFVDETVVDRGSNEYLYKVLLDNKDEFIRISNEKAQKKLNEFIANDIKNQDIDLNINKKCVSCNNKNTIKPIINKKDNNAKINTRQVCNENSLSYEDEIIILNKKY